MSRAASWGAATEAVIAGCESDANIYSALIAGGIVGQLWRSNLMMSAFSGVISFPERADMPIGEYTYFGGIVGDAGVEYGSYSDLLDGVMTKSEIRGCKFSGEIRNESYMGDLYRALAGGICARLYDCEISDAEVCGAFIIADSAFALAALNGGGEGWIEGSVVGDVDLEAMSGMGSVADGRCLSQRLCRQRKLLCRRLRRGLPSSIGKHRRKIFNFRMHGRAAAATDTPVCGYSSRRNSATNQRYDASR